MRRDRGGRPPAGAGRGDQRVPLVLVLPAVPGEPVRRRRRAPGADRPDPALRRTTPASSPPRSTPPSAALDALGPSAADGARLVFVTHSIPLAMAEHRRSRAAQRRRRVRRLAPGGRRRGDPAGGGSRRGAATRATTWSTAPGPVRRASPGWSRTSTTTCAPCAERGCPAVVLVPIGFISDHMEVIFDLDTEARGHRGRAGAAVRPRRDGRRAPGLRGRPGRSDARAGGGGARRGPAPGRWSKDGRCRVVRVPSGLLSEPARAGAPGPGPDRWLTRRRNPSRADGNFGPGRCVIRARHTHDQRSRALHVI